MERLADIVDQTPETGEKKQIKFPYHQLKTSQN